MIMGKHAKNPKMPPRKGAGILWSILTGNGIPTPPPGG